VQHLEEHNIPGEIVFNEISLRDRVKHIKALVFDWDGVFNSGEKGEVPSSFNEIDSMGVNMLRFGYYLHNGENPYTAIVTGATNKTAKEWAEREHFHSVFFNVKHKADALDLMEKEYGVKRNEVLFVFDDIHDLSLAELVGSRFMVKNNGAQKFIQYCKELNLCDYITQQTGANNALREISEVTLDLLGLFRKTIELRTKFQGTYHTYLEERNQVDTHFKKITY